MDMKKIVYLVGAGATQGEMSYAGIEADITMAGISNSVLGMSKAADGRYFKLVEALGIPTSQDVELMISLFEGFSGHTSIPFKEVNRELRRLYRKYLVSQISSNITVPRLLTSLLHIHHKYKKFMGEGGEQILGVLTTNYDSLIEEASKRIYGSINIGSTFKSRDYKADSRIPPILKLHGSFNWKILPSGLKISRKTETSNREQNGWIAPSVYKKPVGVFEAIWDMAEKLLVNCDVLRVIGSSLRNEDWSLISLIFISQVMTDKIFDIELIVPERSATDEDTNRGIMQRLTFLGKVKPPSAMPIFSEGIDEANVFLSWLLDEAREIHAKTIAIDEDPLMEEMLHWGA
jgi:hypothetical protein